MVWLCSAVLGTLAYVGAWRRRLAALTTACREASRMLESIPTPQATSSLGLGLDVGDRGGAAARGQGVLVVVEHGELDAQARQRVDEGVDRAVALADGAAVLPVDEQLGGHLRDVSRRWPVRS